MRRTTIVRRGLGIAIALLAVSSSTAVAGTFSSTGEWRIQANTYVQNTASGLVTGNVKNGWRIGIQRLSPSGEYGYGRIYGGNGYTTCGWVRFDNVNPYKIGERDQSQDCPAGMGDVGNHYNSFSGSGITDGVYVGVKSCQAYENIAGIGAGGGVYPTTTSGALFYRYTTNDGRYAMVRDGSKSGNNWVFADAACVRRPASTYPEFYVDLVLQAVANNQIVTAEYGGGHYLIANRGAVGPWERFPLRNGQFNNGSAITLKAYNGQFAAAENGGGGAVNVNRWNAAQWETFTAVKVNNNGSAAIGQGDLLALRTYSGAHYLVAENAGASPINATRTAIGPWETFRAWFAGNPYP